MPALAKHGIAIYQDIRDTDSGVECYTHLCHESGEEKTFGPLRISSSKPDAQGLAAASTYARRYHLMAVTGVVGDEDDDGEVISGEAKVAKAQVTALKKLIKDVGANEAAFLKVLRVDDLSDLPASKYDGAVERLEAKRKAS